MYKKRPKICSYSLKVFDEQGNEWAEYKGNNDLKPATANVLLLNFRLFKLVLQLFSFLLGFVLYKVISNLL